METAEDYQSQFLYMQALYNIQLGNVSKYLESYVTGTAQRSNRHLQFLAMYAAMAGDIQDPERVYRIYWSIFTNQKLHIELRAGAYIVIMSTRPTMSKLWNIYWIISFCIHASPICFQFEKPRNSVVESKRGSNFKVNQETLQKIHLRELHFRLQRS